MAEFKLKYVFLYTYEITHKDFFWGGGGFVNKKGMDDMHDNIEINSCIQ